MMIVFNDFDPEFPGFRTVPSWRGFGSSLPCRRETTAQHQMDHTSGVCLHHHSYFAFFHLERFLSAYISDLNKGLFHVEIFRQTGLFKNCYFAKLGLLALIDQNTQGEIFDSEMDPSDQEGEVSIWL